MQVESISLEQLIFDPSNARLHGNKNLDAIKGSLTKFGQRTPIVVDEKNVILKGNGTAAAAKEMGWDRIHIIRVTDLTEVQKAAYAIADNRSGELARWDNDVLTQTLLALRDEDFDLGEIGFDDTDLDVILGEIAPIPHTDGHAPEPNAMMTGGKPMDPLAKLNRFLESNVRYMQLIYGEKEYAEVVGFMSALCTHWNMKNHSDLVAHLVRECALANNLEPAEYVEEEGGADESYQGGEAQTA